MKKSPLPRPLTGPRRWLFPLFTATLIPALLLGVIEIGLRAAGTGYPTSFFLPLRDAAGEAPALTTNPRFGWRFFPRALARTPVVERISAAKRPGVYRVFVLGGSAAMGTPEAAFGLGRMLETMLTETYPETRFEVINAAMAAINSHVVREIALEAARLEPDLFVVYMGNNEVVGPYGPGTVFRRFSPSLGAIRAALWAKKSRTGQLVEKLVYGRGPREEEPGEWKGLEMFLDRKVVADDPRLDQVYAHFEANLRDVVEAGRGAGAGVLISTVAVNLRDSPPFASRHRKGLSAEKKRSWEELVERGREGQEGGDHAVALSSFERALEIDDRYAELRFQVGRSLLALGNSDQVRGHLLAARDLDALRFRADSRINEAIRRSAESFAGDGIALVDSERIFEGVGRVPPGNEHFWEHVHLNFEGNYRLARAFFDRLRPLLPERVRKSKPPTPPTAERCAEALPLSEWDRYRMAETILGMTGRPPFTHQLGHFAAQAERRAGVARLREIAGTAADLDEGLYRRALERRPSDLGLRDAFAAYLRGRRRFAEEAGVLERMLQEVPGVAGWRTRLAFAHADAGDPAAAERELEALLEEWPDSPEARVNLGTVVEKRGELDGAEALYRRAIKMAPAAVTARLNLASLLAGRERFSEAETELRQILRIDPGRAPVRNNLGFLLERRGALDDAIAEYRLAVDADPGYALAWFNLADSLFATGDAAGAVEPYRRGLVLAPSNRQARRNLARALQTAGVAEPPAGGAGEG